MKPELEHLVTLAKEWQNANRNSAVGFGAGSRMMDDAVDQAKRNFVAALATARPALVADALVMLASYERQAGRETVHGVEA